MKCLIDISIFVSLVGISIVAGKSSSLYGEEDDVIILNGDNFKQQVFERYSLTVGRPTIICLL